jgi:hypothetical protein
LTATGAGASGRRAFFAPALTLVVTNPPKGWGYVDETFVDLPDQTPQRKAIEACHPVGDMNVRF